MASVATFEPIAATAAAAPTTASTTTNTTTTTTRSSHKQRKRAPKACLSCRARKVRCDVSQRGRPCMNCYLDSETCVVTSRASRFRKVGREGSEGAHVSHPPYSVDNRNNGSAVEDVTLPQQAELIKVANNDPRTSGNMYIPPGPNGSTQAEIQWDQSSYQSFNEHPEPLLNRQSNVQPTFNDPSPVPLPSPIPMPSPVPLASPVPPQSFDSLGNTSLPFWVGEQPVALNSDVTYSYYPFLSLNNLHNVSPQDVNYLESQGCLRVPTRAILDEFVQQYFLHVHPLLPFIDEGDFWNIYGQEGGQGGTGGKMSLLVFQAMLFACCNFISKSSAKALGHTNVRTARATLYRRTKLLFDLDTESSLVCLSQAALLLTYWAPNWSLATRKPNTAWLGVAIQNAKSAEAHIYSAMPSFSPVVEPGEHKRQNGLKRLWWCCVLRDRLVSLGMRRSVQISRAHFDVDANPGLGFADLAGEVGRSRVYNAETKRRLIEIFAQMSELLCSVLTDLLTLVFPLDDVPGWGRQNGIEGVEKVRKCKAELRRWYKGATFRFPMFGGGGEGSKMKEDIVQHDSVILYTNLMYMFYHSSRAALCHHEVLQMAMASAAPNLSNNNLRGFSNIYESRHELQDAACGVTECMNELVQRGLARWLPISAMACTAIPLMLHIIDVKLSSQNKRRARTPDDRRRTALKQQRLNILIEAMKTYQPQYDGVDYISETIRHIINLAQIDPPTDGPETPSISSLSQDSSMQPIISDWTDILASNPGSYLRLAMTMDISISKGRLAKETDFPLKLRGLFAHGLSPIRALLAGSHARMPQPSPLGNPAPHIPPMGSVHPVSSDEGSTSPDSVSGMDHGVAVPLDNHDNNNINNNNNDYNSNSGNAHAPSQTSDTLSASFSLLDGAEAGVQDVAMQMFVDVDYALSADALAAYVMESGNDEDNHHGYDGQGGGGGCRDGAETEDRAGADNESAVRHDMYDGGEADWIGHQAWDDEGMRGAGEEMTGAPDSDAGDKETARVLLDALQDDAALCTR